MQPPNLPLAPNGKRVLIVEDDAVMESLLHRMLESWGFETYGAVSAEAAVKAALMSGPFDAIISDHNLPQASGIGFERWLREQVISIPFILISGQRPTQFEPTNRTRFLSKPFRMDELAALLEEMLPGLGSLQSAGSPGESL